MFKNLLPIGSVVLLNGGIKKIMITGMKPVKSGDPDKVYDYIGVLYPEGYLNNKYNVLFNHSDINEVVFEGYKSPERDALMMLLQEAYENEEKN